jgi:hypothetical protein
MDPRAQLRAYWREVHAKRAARKEGKGGDEDDDERRPGKFRIESKEDEKQAKEVAVKSE